MGITVGDLVQFKQEKTHSRKCWNQFPETFHWFSLGWVPLVAWASANRPFFRYGETEKIPMVISDIRMKCFSQSKLPLIRKSLTKTFIRVLIFRDKTNIYSGPTPLWVLLDDVEEFTDKSYMDELKLKLNHSLGKQKISCD